MQLSMQECSALACLIPLVLPHPVRLSSLSVSVLNAIHRLALSSTGTMIPDVPSLILSRHWKVVQTASTLPACVCEHALARPRSAADAPDDHFTDQSIRWSRSPPAPVGRLTVSRIVWRST